VVLVIVAGSIASLNAAVIAAVRATPVAPEPGVVAVIVGGLVSAVVKDHVTSVAIGFPARSVTPLTPPLTTTVHVSGPDRGAAGTSVATNVLALYVTVAAIVVFAAFRSCIVLAVIVAAAIASLNVAVIAVAPATLVAPLPGA
jgi:hypothetical protein